MAQTVAPDAVADLQGGQVFSKSFLVSKDVAGSSSVPIQRVEILPTVGTAVSNSDVERVLRELSVQFSGTESHWLRLDIRKPDSGDDTKPGMNDNDLLATTLQQVNLTTSLKFEALENEKGLLHTKLTADEFVRSDAQMKLFPSPSSTVGTDQFWARIETIGPKQGSDKLRLPAGTSSGHTIDDSRAVSGIWILKPDAASSPRSQKQFEDAVSELEFKFGDTPDCRTLQYQFFTSNPGNLKETAKGACLRVVSRHSRDFKPSALRTRIGNLLGQLTATTMSPSSLAAVINTFKADIGFQAAPPELPSWTQTEAASGASLPSALRIGELRRLSPTSTRQGRASCPLSRGQ